MLIPLSQLCHELAQDSKAICRVLDFSMRSCFTIRAFTAIPFLPFFIPIWTAAAVSASNHEPLHLPDSNASSLSIPTIPIDPKFKIEGSYSQVALDEVSVLFNGLHFMADLALYSWNAGLSSQQSRVMQVYPSVEIEARTELAGNLPMHFFLWGLNMALFNLVFRNQFVEADFKLLYQKQKVGTITFRTRPHTALLAPSLAVEAGQSNNSLDLPAHIEKSSILVGAQVVNNMIEIRLAPNARSLTRNHVFLILYSSLREVAFPEDDAICNERIKVGPSGNRDVTVVFSSQRGPGLPRTQAPYLTYATIIKVIRLVPEWMISRYGSFSEVIFYIYDLNVVVGVGSVTRGDFFNLQLPLVIPGTNVSIS